LHVEQKDFGELDRIGIGLAWYSLEVVFHTVQPAIEGIMFSPKTRAKAHRTRLILDCLESRFVPAGNVTTFRLFGNQLLVGDANSNQIVISQITLGTITIAGTGGTMVNGSSVVTIPLTGNLAIALGAGDDSITFDLTSGMHLPGNVTIDYGGPNAGIGTKTTQTTSATSNFLTVDGNFGIRYAKGNVTTVLDNMAVSGSMTVLHAAGDSVFTLDNLKGAGSFSTIAGNLNIVNTLGQAKNQIIDTNVGFNVNILNGFARTADNSAGFNQIFNVNNTSTLSSIGASLFVKNGNGTSSTNPTTGLSGDLLADVHVVGNANLRLGAGTGTLVPLPFNATVAAFSATGVTIDHSLAVVGNATWKGTIALGAPVTGLTVKGNLMVNSGNLPATIKLDDVTVLMATKIFTGMGADTITIDGSAGDLGSVFGGSFIVGTGPGADTMSINSGAAVAATTRFKGRVNVSLGRDDDTLHLAKSGTVNFEAPVPTQLLFDGSTGANTLDDTPANIGVRTPTFKNFA
jgi:hypothetical protein